MTKNQFKKKLCNSLFVFTIHNRLTFEKNCVLLQLQIL